MKEPIRASRKFRIWEYRVSHDQLLLRSPKDSASRNFDVIFVGVQYFALPSYFDGLEISLGTTEEILRVQQDYGKPVLAERVFSLRSNGAQHVVVAASVRVSENDLDMFESSLDSF